VSTWRWEFEEALHRIDAYLSQGVPEGVVGSQYSLARPTTILPATSIPRTPAQLAGDRHRTEYLSPG